MIKTNGVDLCTQAFGDPANPALTVLNSDGVRRSEVEVLETVEPDSTGAHTGSRCGHVSGGPATSRLVCSVLCI
jgi:hypothetical protein